MARQKPQLKLATMRLEEQEIQKTEMMKKEIMEEEGEYENGGGGNENGGGGNENGGGGNENEGQEMTMEEGDEPGDDDNDQGNGEEENEEENKEDQEAENEEEDKEDQEDENEEEEKEKDKDLPATPPGEASRSEEEWKKRGLNANDIRTKRFRKQQRHRLCEKGKRSLEALQDEITDTERVDYMPAAVESPQDAAAPQASLEERKAQEREKPRKRIQEEIEKRQRLEEQGKKIEELLKDIEIQEKKKKGCISLPKWSRSQKIQKMSLSHKCSKIFATALSAKPRAICARGSVWMPGAAAITCCRQMQAKSSPNVAMPPQEGDGLQKAGRLSWRIKWRASPWPMH